MRIHEVKRGWAGARRFLPAVIPAIFLLVWITVSATGLIPTYLLPHPLKIAETGYAYVLGRPGAARENVTDEEPENATDYRQRDRAGIL